MNIETQSPTTLPPGSFCIPIRVDIIDFDAFNSDDLSDDILLQNEVANTTHFAIAQIGENHDINSDSFYVLYNDSSADSQYIDGDLQRSVFINESLCTFGADDLQSLTLIMQYEGEAIASILSKKLTSIYSNREASESMEVSIYILNQLRHSIMYKPRHALKCFKKLTITY